MTALPDEFGETRAALHTVTEHVLSAASYTAIGKIGMRANESGFSTQDLHGTTYTVSGPFLTDGERSLLLTGSTLGGVAEWMGVIPGAPTSVYTPTTPLDLDTPLAVDATSAIMIGEWFAGMQIVLAKLFPDEVIQLWPEHFDLAAGKYGASPGDHHIAEPYLYILMAEGGFDAMPYSELVKAQDPMAAAEGYFQRGKRLFG